MATRISISGWGVDRTYALNVWEESYDSVANTSVVGWQVLSEGSSTKYDYYLKATVNGTTVWNSSGSWSDSFPSATGVKGGYLTISHESDGKKSISLYIEGYAYQYSTKSASGTLTLTNIDRTAPTITASSASNISVSGFQITATSNVQCRQWAYRIKKSSGSYGEWTGWDNTSGTSHTFNISGLSNNTTYVIQLTGRKTVNDIYGFSGEVTVKTLGASTITSVTNTTLGNAPAVKWTPLNSTFEFRIKYTYGSWSWTSGYIDPNSTAQQTYNAYALPLADLANLMPNTTTATMTCTLYTYTSGHANVGNSSKTFTITVPSSVVPVFGSTTVTPQNDGGFGNDIVVQSLSKIQGDAVVSGQYNATIKSVTMSVEGQNYPLTLSSGHWRATSSILMTTGSVPVTFTAVDSRGRTATASGPVTSIEYYVPSFTMDVDVYDTTITVTVNGQIAPVDNRNAKRLVITRVRLDDQTTQTFTINPLSSYTFSETWTQTLADASTSTYEYTVEVFDSINTATQAQKTGIVTLSLLGGGGGAAFFAPAMQKGLWINQIRHDITEAEYLEIANLLASEYSASDSYAVGEWVTYNSSVWECTTAITGGEAWTASHWDELGV